MKKPSNTQAVLIGAGFSTLVGLFTVKLIEIMNAEQTKREAIELDTEKQIAEIKYARDVMLQRIDSGAYDQAGLQAIKNDLEFYRLSYRFSQ